MPGPRFLRRIAATAVAVVLLAGCSDGGSEANGSTAGASASESSVQGVAGNRSEVPSADPSPAWGPALEALNRLEVKGKAPRTGYDRLKEFGPAWKDVDHNGCDTRNDILNRDMTAVRHKSGTHDCTVTTGRLADPYTGREIHFVAGQKTSSAVQIDHVVALSNAWQTGAQGLDQDAREHLANDPLNLLASDGTANMQKSDGDAATWLPSNKAFRCQYVARQVAVKSDYHLWVTRAEKDAIAAVLDGCAGEPLPRAGAAPVVEPRGATAASSPSAVSSPSPRDRGPEDVYYSICSEARAAGAAPLRRGQPGYRAALDGDDDGTACEA